MQTKTIENGIVYNFIKVTKTVDAELYNVMNSVFAKNSVVSEFPDPIDPTQLRAGLSAANIEHITIETERTIFALPSGSDTRLCLMQIGTNQIIQILSGTVLTIKEIIGVRDYNLSILSNDTLLKVSADAKVKYVSWNNTVLKLEDEVDYLARVINNEISGTVI